MNPANTPSTARVNSQRNAYICQGKCHTILGRAHVVQLKVTPHIIIALMQFQSKLTFSIRIFKCFVSDLFCDK